MCRFRVDQSSEMLSMFRFVVLSKTLTLSLLVLGCLMLSRGYTDVKDVLECDPANYTEVPNVRVLCSADNCSLILQSGSNYVHDLNISWKRSSLPLNESCVNFACYSNITGNDTNGTCALYDIPCNVTCDIRGTPNGSTDGGGGGSSAKTGLIVFVVLLIVALIGTVIAIVILAWMVREMQSEREGKALPSPISCIMGILPLSIFHSSDEKPAKSTSHTKQKDKRSSEPQHHRQKDDDKRASSDLEGESPDHDADDYEEMDPMKRGSFIAVDDDIYQNN